MRTGVKMKVANERGAGLVELALVLFALSGTMVIYFNQILPKMNKLDREADMLASFHGMINSGLNMEYLDYTGKISIQDPTAVITPALEAAVEELATGTTGADSICMTAYLLNQDNENCTSVDPNNNRQFIASVADSGSPYIGNAEDDICGTIDGYTALPDMPDPVEFAFYKGICKRRMVVLLYKEMEPERVFASFTVSADAS